MWNFIKNIFKKKKHKEVKMDFSNINFNFNVKSICAFEKMNDKSFFEMVDEDIFQLLYAIYITSNPNNPLNQKVFFYMLENEKIAKWFLQKYMSIAEICEEFKSKVKESKDENNNEPVKVRITDYVTTMVVEYGINPHYIMYEMDLWELSEYYEAIDTKMKRDAVNKRFWTYVNVMPHIDTKKCKSPQHLVPFDWEKESIKKKQETELKNNMYAIKNMIGKSIFGDKDKENG